ncbi:hypothetical protein ACKVMT_15295 [Halobacteriales archaeon Cl-PHB]
MRATSTVVDAAVFLVLVSVAVTTLAPPTPAQPDGSADDVAETLASATEAVTYDYDTDTTESTVRRRATGTYADLLGRAAIADLILDGQMLTPGTGAYVTAIRNATANLTRWNDHRTRIVARWVPYEGAPLRGSVAVGPVTPAGVDASVTTIRVPVPVDSVDETAVERQGGGYDGVATAVAAAVVSASLPADRVAYGDPGSATRRVAVSRYRAAADAMGASVEGTLEAGEPGRATARIRDSLADRLAADLRARFDSHGAAIEALETGHATIAVVEWEP